MTFLILLIAFGAIVASVIPLLLAITSLAAAYGFLALYSQTVGAVSPNATQLIVLMGLAVAVDYSLFMITRFRTERRRGATIPDAIETSSSTAGRAVFFSDRGRHLARRPRDPGDQPVHVDGRRDDGGRGRLGHRQPDVPAGDAGDRRRSGEPRATDHWIPRLFRLRGSLDTIDRRAARPPGSGIWAAR